MKRLLIAALLLAVAPLALEAQANSNQIKKKTDGGLTGDANLAITVICPRSGSAPASPLTGQCWCDTATTPCTPKWYDGSAWQAGTSVSVVSTQADLSSFPGSPTSGQIFYDKSHFVLWIYDSTASAWYSANGSGAHTGSAIVDNFAGSTISAPSSGMTIADGGAAGNMAAGLHSCKVTFGNAAGGETTASPATASVTFTASHKITYASIPTGGTGTTQRRIYCSKATFDISGPWYWAYTVNDNSTTTVTADAGVADASLVLLVPKSNYSAALNARWTVTNNTASTTTGGCGATGSSMACYSSNTTPPTSTITSDTTVRTALDLTSYNTGDYTVQYRVTKAHSTADTADVQILNVNLGGMRVGSANLNPHFWAGLGSAQMNGNVCSGSGANWQSPLDTSGAGSTSMPTMLLSRLSNSANYTINGGACNTTGTFYQPNPFPNPTNYLWVKWVKKGTKLGAYTSGNGRDWTGLLPRGSLTATTLNYYDISANNPTQFEFNIMQVNGTGWYYIEIDNFTLTVN